MSTADRIIALVAEHYGVTEQDLRGRSREQRFARPRHVAMLLLCERKKDGRPRHSLTWIARVFRRDHTTVLYAREHTRQRAQSDLDLAAALAVLRERAARLDSEDQGSRARRPPGLEAGVSLESQA